MDPISSNQFPLHYPLPKTPTPPSFQKIFDILKSWGAVDSTGRIKVQYEFSSTHVDHVRYQSLLNLPIKIEMDGKFLETTQEKFILGFQEYLAERLKDPEMKTYLRGSAVFYVVKLHLYFTELVDFFLKGCDLYEKERRKKAVTPFLEKLSQEWEEMECPKDLDWIFHANTSANDAKFYITGYLQQQGITQDFQRILRDSFDNLVKAGRTYLRLEQADFLIASFKRSGISTDLAIGRLKRERLFSFQDVRIPFPFCQTLDQVVTPLCQVVIDHLLKIVRMEPWHENNFFALIGILHYLSKGYHIQTEKNSLEDAFRFFWMSIKGEEKAYKELLRAIDGNIKNHSVEPVGFLLLCMIFLSKTLSHTEENKPYLTKLWEDIQKRIEIYGVNKNPELQNVLNAKDFNQAQEILVETAVLAMCAPSPSIYIEDNYDAGVLLHVLGLTIFLPKFLFGKASSPQTMESLFPLKTLRSSEPVIKVFLDKFLEVNPFSLAEISPYRTFLHLQRACPEKPLTSHLKWAFVHFFLPYSNLETKRCVGQWLSPWYPFLAKGEQSSSTVLSGIVEHHPEEVKEIWSLIKRFASFENQLQALKSAIPHLEHVPFLKELTKFLIHKFKKPTKLFRECVHVVFKKLSNKDLDNEFVALLNFCAQNRILESKDLERHVQERLQGGDLCKNYLFWCQISSFGFSQEKTLERFQAAKNAFMQSETTSFNPEVLITYIENLLHDSNSEEAFQVIKAVHPHLQKEKVSELLDKVLKALKNNSRLLAEFCNSFASQYIQDSNLVKAYSVVFLEKGHVDDVVAALFSPLVKEKQALMCKIIQQLKLKMDERGYLHLLQKLLEDIPTNQHVIYELLQLNFWSQNSKFNEKLQKLLGEYHDVLAMHYREKPERICHLLKVLSLFNVKGSKAQEIYLKGILEAPKHERRALYLSSYKLARFTECSEDHFSVLNSLIQEIECVDGCRQLLNILKTFPIIHVELIEKFIGKGPLETIFLDWINELPQRISETFVERALKKDLGVEALFILSKNPYLNLLELINHLKRILQAPLKDISCSKLFEVIKKTHFDDISILLPFYENVFAGADQGLKKKLTTYFFQFQGDQQEISYSKCYNLCLKAIPTLSFEDDFILKICEGCEEKNEVYQAIVSSVLQKISPKDSSCVERLIPIHTMLPFNLRDEQRFFALLAFNTSILIKHSPILVDRYIEILESPITKDERVWIEQALLHIFHYVQVKDLFQLHESGWHLIYTLLPPSFEAQVRLATFQKLNALTLHVLNNCIKSEQEVDEDLLFEFIQAVLENSNLEFHKKARILANRLKSPHKRGSALALVVKKITEDQIIHHPENFRAIFYEMAASHFHLTEENMRLVQNIWDILAVNIATYTLRYPVINDLFFDALSCILSINALHLRKTQSAKMVFTTCLQDNPKKMSEVIHFLEKLFPHFVQGFPTAKNLRLFRNTFSFLVKEFIQHKTKAEFVTLIPVLDFFHYHLLSTIDNSLPYEEQKAQFKEAEDFLTSIKQNLPRSKEYEYTHALNFPLSRQVINVEAILTYFKNLCLVCPSRYNLSRAVKLYSAIKIPVQNMGTAVKDFEFILDSLKKLTQRKDTDLAVFYHDMNELFIPILDSQQIHPLYIKYLGRLYLQFQHEKEVLELLLHSYRLAVQNKIIPHVKYTALLESLIQLQDQGTPIIPVGSKVDPVFSALCQFNEPYAGSSITRWCTALIKTPSHSSYVLQLYKLACNKDLLTENLKQTIREQLNSALRSQQHT